MTRRQVINLWVMQYSDSREVFVFI